MRAAAFENIDVIEMNQALKHANARFSLEDEVLSVLYLFMLKTVLEARGHSLKGFNEAKLRLMDHRTRITPRQFLSVLDASLDCAKSAELGFHYGKLLNIAGAGTVGQLLMSCSTLEEVFNKFLKYYPLLSLSVQVDVSELNGQYILKVDHFFGHHLSTRSQWFLTEALFYSWLSQCRWMTGKQLALKKATFRYPPPPHQQMYRSLLGCDVEFNAPANSMVLRRDFLQHKVVTANESVRIVAERHCQKALLRRLSQCSIQERIKTQLESTLPEIPCLDAMARQLNLSRSSLYRKLREEGCSYQHLVDHFRRDLAIRALQDSCLSIGEIAEKLGFSDASNFRRAFKKWTGSNPSEVRLDDSGLTPDVPEAASF